MKRKPTLPSADTTPTAKLTHAQIEAMVRENRWWPFTRVPTRILPRMHRSIVSGHQPTEEEPALL